jgi:hypothetical protein
VLAQTQELRGGSEGQCELSPSVLLSSKAKFLTTVLKVLTGLCSWSTVKIYPKAQDGPSFLLIEHLD